MQKSTYSAYLDKAKSTLKVREFKKFQTDCITAVREGRDVVVVQPTGSGKSVCFVLPALLFPGKVSLVIEPVIAVIINQVATLQKNGINAIPLGNAAATSEKSMNYRMVFKQTLDAPIVAFCTLRIHFWKTFHRHKHRICWPI